MKSSVMKRQTKSKLIGFTALLALVSACEQNPYPSSDEGTISENQLEPNPVAPPFSIEMLQVLECQEGKECKMTVKGHVPEGGRPILTFKDLPAGMTYDAANDVITFVPSFDLVDVAADPTTTAKTFVSQVELKSSNVPNTVTRRSFSITVKNVYRPITIRTGGARVTMKEGDSFTETVTVESLDFPNGPFQLNLRDAPAGVTIAQDGAPNRFRVSYSPNRFTVTVNDPAVGSRFTKTFNVGYHVSTLTGYNVESKVEWLVQDDRLAPYVSAPLETTQGPDVNFSIRAEDLNGERAPIIRVNPTVPFGTLTVREEAVTPPTSGNVLPSRLFNVRWTDIPRTSLGQTVPVLFTVCGPSTRTEDTICKNYETKVNLVAGTRPMPLVDRTAWPLAKIQYAKVGVETTIPLPILDAETRTATASVKIMPESMATVARWENGQLKVKPLVEGAQQFSVIATSIYNQSSVEGFIFEAFPAERSDTVILTDTTFPKEVTEAQRILGGGDILSSIFQLDARNLALRKTLVITTTAMNNPQAVAQIEKFSDSVKTVVLSTPLLEKSRKLSDEVKSLGLTIQSRLSTVANQVFALNTALGLAPLNRAASLKGNLTSESGKPLPFGRAVLRAQKCQDFLDLQRAGSNTENRLGALCERANGGTLVVLGFEIGDMALSDADTAVVKSWFEKIAQ